MWKSWKRWDGKRASLRRYRLTSAFVGSSLRPGAKVLDLGSPNDLGRLFESLGYEVSNSDGDLDKHPEIVAGFDGDAAFAFEILEHLVGPVNVLRRLPVNRLFASVPLRLWFARAYRNPRDPWDRHFHEFEDWQFDWLLEAAGWTVVRSERWTSPVTTPGIRSFLRLFVPRYYIVEARRTPGQPAQDLQRN